MHKLTPELINALREPFPAETHKERELPGGGKWFFIPWQLIRKRLNDVYPDWQVEYGTPIYLGDFCTVSCTLTIAGVSRQAWGNAPVELLSKSGRDMSRGTPIERAIADSFKNAAEAFGIGAYLDNQEFVIQHLRKAGIHTAYAYSDQRREIRQRNGHPV